ncbi:hypothetical protein M885DRAFT_514730 [Pelagophyceae sp. CCMP2097]|nr:hypothetical protein M885DRAFT_514730 [Pelagophyceae sp. CCMP2097]
MRPILLSSASESRAAATPSMRVEMDREDLVHSQRCTTRGHVSRARSGSRETPYWRRLIVVMASSTMPGDPRAARQVHSKRPISAPLSRETMASAISGGSTARRPSAAKGASRGGSWSSSAHTSSPRSDCISETTENSSTSTTAAAAAGLCFCAGAGGALAPQGAVSERLPSRTSSETSSALSASPAQTLGASPSSIMFADAASQSGARAAPAGDLGARDRDRSARGLRSQRRFSAGGGPPQMRFAPRALCDRVVTKTPVSCGASASAASWSCGAAGGRRGDARVGRRVFLLFAARAGGRESSSSSTSATSCFASSSPPDPLSLPSSTSSRDWTPSQSASNRCIGLESRPTSSSPALSSVSTSAMLWCACARTISPAIDDDTGRARGDGFEGIAPDGRLRDVCYPR